ncbi:MAG: hypothetical protein ABJE95_04275 [Byssovorax sp.]
MATRRRALIGLAAAIALLPACASALPPPVIRDAAPVAEKIDPGPTSMESEIGGLNEEAMDRAFASLEVQRCLTEGSSRLSAIGGEFKLRLRINRDGGARWAYVSESTLGDRATEKCLLDLVRNRSWPKPVGGEGLAEKAYAIDAPTAPVVLEEKRMLADVARARAAASSCRHGVKGSFFATVHVRPDGRISAAGVAPPSERGEDVADCVVDAIRKLRFRRAAPRAAKVSFEIR